MIQDLLVFYRMDYTLSVYQNEANLVQGHQVKNKDIEDTLGIALDNQQKSPHLLQLFHFI